AVDDTALTRAFGDIARQEYRAVGIHMALAPQADLATEPRWPRVAGTFGEDADLAGRHVRAYVTGFQHGPNGVDSTGVVAVVKHWVGYGAAKDGWDSHLYYGRFATFPAHDLEYHIRPFLGAFAAHAAGVMPTYSVLEGATWDGKPIEPVGAGFNRQLLTDMLRARYGFQGVAVTDWSITRDCPERCKNGDAAGREPGVRGCRCRRATARPRAAREQVAQEQPPSAAAAGVARLRAACVPAWHLGGGGHTRGVDGRDRPEEGRHRDRASQCAV